MRVLLAIVLIVLLAVLGLPYWFGIRTQKVYNELVTGYSVSDNVSIIEKSYDRGWLSSRAKTVFSIKNGGAELIRFEEDDTIFHGPFPIQAMLSGRAGLQPVMAIIDSHLIVIPAEGSEYSDIIKKLPPANLLTTVSLDGGGVTDITMPGIETTVGAKGEQLKWQGLTGDITFVPGFENVDTSLKSAGLKIAGKDSILTVADVAGHYRIKYVGPENKYPVGDFEVSVGKVALNTKKEQSEEYKKFALTGIKMTGESTEDRGNLNSKYSLGFDELLVGNDKYGPGVFELAVRNVDMVSWMKIQEVLKKNQNAPQTEEARQKFMAEIMKIVPDLIKKSPEIEITKLSLETSNGNLDGHLKITVDGSDLENPDLAANPLFLLTAIKAKARVTVAKALLENILTDYKTEEITDDFKKANDEIPPDQEILGMAKEEAADEIKGLKDQNVITESGDNYELKAGYEMGQILLNGKPIDMESLLGQ
jgi:uncharacterized protein YdgA (DUF945 family)